MKIIIKPKKITRKNFKKFGDVISTKKIKSIILELIFILMVEFRELEPLEKL